MCETRWPPHRPEGTLVHSRIPSPVDQQKIKRIRECMCNHRHRKVSSARQIQPTEYESVQNILHHASAALVDVRATKRNTDHDHAYSPSHFRTTKQASRTIHEVAAIDQLLSQSSEHPYQRQINQQQLQIPNEVRKIRQVGHL